LKASLLAKDLNVFFLLAFSFTLGDHMACPAGKPGGKAKRCRADEHHPERAHNLNEAPTPSILICSLRKPRWARIKA
jgi:hypothetical protein